MAAPCVLAAAVVVILAGCSTSPDLPRVSVIGDSMTALAQPDISTELEGTFAVGFVFRISVRIGQMLDLVASDLRDNRPTEAAVINLGTNDAIAGGDSAQALATFDQLLRTVGPVRCVVLTTIGPFADDRGRSDVGASLNRRMDGLVAADPRRYKLVDWSRLLGTLDPEARRFVLQPDQIHETEAGARWIANSDKAALDTCGTDGQPSMLPVPGP